MHGSFSLLTPLFAAAESETAHLPQVAGFLGLLYLALALANGSAALYWWQRKGDGSRALLWAAVGLFFVVMAPLGMSGHASWMPSIPQAVRDLVDNATGPVVYSVGTTLVLVVMFVFRRFFVKPDVAWTMLNLALLLMGLAMTDRDFFAIVGKPDNVPIVAMVFLLGFFTWLATAKAVENDDRLAQGLPPTEKLDNEKVLVWPDLVYTELVCMIALTALLILWAIVLKAPLEEPASSVKTPNPSRRLGTSWVCRKCWCTTIRGTRAWCCRA
jgi:hypothetical protein